MASGPRIAIGLSAMAPPRNVSAWSRCLVGAGRDWIIAMTTTPEPQRREPALRTIAMPADANANGDIFGGWVLAQMDLAGGSLAVRRARGRVATVAVTGMTFHLPIYIGDEVSCYGTITKIGR